MPANVVSLTHVRKVEVANAMVLIKANQEPAIADRDVSRHKDRPFQSGGNKFQHLF